MGFAALSYAWLALLVLGYLHRLTKNSGAFANVAQYFPGSEQHHSSVVKAVSNGPLASPF